MDRNIPEAWSIFGMQGSHPPGSQHVNCSSQNQELMRRWCDRTSNCDRPRTYDKFYTKTPGNFRRQPECSSNQSSKKVETTDSAISVCSSEEEKEQQEQQKRVKKKRSKGRRELQYSRTLTERDVQHLERHLSMKKTIRKKIMRDLQQAFVPEGVQQQQQEINLNALNFHDNRVQHHKSEQRFLDMLRDSSDDSGLGSPTPGGRSVNSGGNRHKFNSVRERPKPRYQFGGAVAASEHQVVVLTAEEQQKKPKRTFWQILTGRNKEKKNKKTLT